MAKNEATTPNSKDKGPAPDLVTRPTNALAPLTEYGDDAGGGFENVTQDDQSIPFLQVLQTGSPQVMNGDPKQIRGAVAGMLHNTLTNEVYDFAKGLIAIPALTDHCFVEWVPRDKGGGKGNGFVGRHDLASPVVAAARDKAKSRNELSTEAGNDLAETFYMYALTQVPKFDLSKGNFPSNILELIDMEDMGSPVLIPFVSTKITPYKAIMTNLNTFKIPGKPHPQNQPPLWAFPLWFRTALETRDAGNSYNFRISFANGAKIEESKLLPRFRPAVEGHQAREEYPLYAAARELRRAIAAGTVKVNYNNQDSAVRAQRGGSTGGDEVPF